MSLADLMPGLLSLSRCDKLRLIRYLAVDLEKSEDLLSKSTNRMRLEAREHETDIQEDERVQEVVHSDGLRDVVGRLQKEGNTPGPDEVGIDHSDRVTKPPIEASPNYPYWSPDRDHEAATILLRMLEAGKSDS